jgi:hypothetical protein
VNAKIAGPAVVEERESTMVMNGPATAWVDPSGSLVVRLPKIEPPGSGLEPAASDRMRGKE